MLPSRGDGQPMALRGDRMGRAICLPRRSRRKSAGRARSPRCRAVRIAGASTRITSRRQQGRGRRPPPIRGSARAGNAADSRHGERPHDGVRVGSRNRAVRCAPLGRRGTSRTDAGTDRTRRVPHRNASGDGRRWPVSSSRAPAPAADARLGRRSRSADDRGEPARLAEATASHVASRTRLKNRRGSARARRRENRSAAYAAYVSTGSAAPTTRPRSAAVFETRSSCGAERSPSSRGVGQRWDRTWSCQPHR